MTVWLVMTAINGAFTGASFSTMLRTRQAERRMRLQRALSIEAEINAWADAYFYSGTEKGNEEK